MAGIVLAACCAAVPKRCSRGQERGRPERVVPQHAIGRRDLDRRDVETIEYDRLRGPAAEVAALGELDRLHLPADLRHHRIGQAGVGDGPQQPTEGVRVVLDRHTGHFEHGVLVGKVRDVQRRKDQIEAGYRFFATPQFVEITVLGGADRAHVRVPEAL